MARDFIEIVSAPIRIKKSERRMFPEADPEIVAHRIQVIIDTLAAGKRKIFAEATGISQARLSHILSASKQTISVPDAIRVCRAYSVSLDFIYRGDRDGLPLPLQRAIDARVLAGTWRDMATHDGSRTNR